MASKEYKFTSYGEQETDRLGAALALSLAPGSIVALVGTLGAGKTRLVQAVAASLGVPPGEATSPTFVLINEYLGDKTVYHVDAYRLRDDDEFFELGLDELFASPALIFVEWADKFAELMPSDRLEIRIEPVGPTTRQFSLAALGDVSRRCLAELADRLDNSG